MEKGERLTLIGMATNLVLVGLKLGVGATIGSLALIADGVHSLSDLATDLAVLAGMRLARRPPDGDHAYGHGKFETLAGAFVSTVLLAAAILIAAEAFRDLRARPSPPGLPILAVAIVSLGTKEYLFRRTLAAAGETGSLALRANAWHHRSDALSSLAVLLGGTAAALGYGVGDPAAGMAVGIAIAASALRLVWESLHELSEGRLRREEEAAVVRAIEGVAGVRGWHALRTRRSGRTPFVDVHILVDPDLPVREAHRIATAVEEAISKTLGGGSVVVHVEPEEE